MQIIISDTTAIIILSKIKRLDLIFNFFEKIYIPKAVYEEISKKNDSVSKDIQNNSLIETKEINDIELYNNLRLQNLDYGESEAIVLAKELHLLLLIDEKDGRKRALEQNLNIIGMLGIIEYNFKHNKLTYSEVVEITEKMKKVGFRLKETFLNHFLEKIQK